MAFARERRENEIIKNMRDVDDFLRLNQPLHRHDAIIALGNNDNRTAIKAGQLYVGHYAPLMLITGGIGSRTIERSVSEAERYLSLIVNRYPQIDPSAVILETRATNTGQNVINSRQTLESLSIFPYSVLAVTKPFVERRAFHTFIKQWPQLHDLTVTSPQYPFEEYFDDQDTPSSVARKMVSEVDKLHSYQQPNLGYIYPVYIPSNVDRSCERILSLLPADTPQLRQPQF